ncbi:hypothetical protein Tsp_08870 [Trichinella spiralis]|uniref:hypothetical protein n=1 Tax=Trichinella spiralis TaxID=6334 RepID=UPI0001EFE8A5|nr:hypothetical protein Tsp_08870 [Trichinella spiralis]
MYIFNLAFYEPRLVTRIGCFFWSAQFYLNKTPNSLVAFFCAFSITAVARLSQGQPKAVFTLGEADRFVFSGQQSLTNFYWIPPRALVSSSSGWFGSHMHRFCKDPEMTARLVDTSPFQRANSPDN